MFITMDTLKDTTREDLEEWGPQQLLVMCSREPGRGLQVLVWGWPPLEAPACPALRPFQTPLTVTRWPEDSCGEQSTNQRGEGNQALDTGEPGGAAAEGGY